MAGVAKNKGIYCPGGAADGAEASCQASQGRSGWEFDVFLSFRGADTRNGFTGHLYRRLKDKGIHTFMDDKGLKKGEKVEKLLGYIERSKIFVPIFSEHYADSKWCLKEITKIVECKKLIIPIFFHVEPSVVQHQKEPFKQALETHERDGEQEVSKWREALRLVGEISGFHLKDDKDHEAALTDDILKTIMNEVKPWHLEVTEYPIGLDSHVNDVIRLLLDEKIGMVGICGMGGIGKTTLAKAVYNELCSRFEAWSFLANVREESKQHKGIVALQRQLLKDVFRDEREITSEDQGISMIKERIGSKQVLLVIDDIDDDDQLYKLTGSRSGWFGGESRIIVTSRDAKVLNVSESSIYRLPEFDPVQSLQLFSSHAFGEPKPRSDRLKELSKEIVLIAGGLPLCLTVFGSYFSGLESLEVWESKLEKLKMDPPKAVHERLKISYDSLDEKTKCIFLDIACFLHGNWEKYNSWDPQRWVERREKKEYAMQMWKSSELYPTVAVAELERKSLISINNKHGTFEMHDQIRDMGRNIVRQQKPAPSRLWENSKTEEVLQRKQGLENIEGIIFHRLHQQHMTPLNTMSFKNMAELRILDTSFVRLEGSYHDLPNSLKFLRWWQCPLKSLAVDFPVHNIVVLDLTYSTIEHFLGPSGTSLWPFGCFQPQEANHSGKFSQLKVLILKDCKNLKSTPDFRLIPNATKLIFEGCINLRQVHESIGDIQRLVCLNLKDCRSLKKIPDSICRLSSLEILNLESCWNILTLPEKLGDLLSLKELHLAGCSQPMDVVDLTKLRCLEYLNLKGCHALEDINHMMKPQEANHSGRFSQLKVLNLENCTKLKSTPNFTLIPNAIELIFEGCTNLSQVHESIGDLQSLVCLNLYFCTSLEKIPDSICRLNSLEILNLDSCNKISTLPEKFGDLLSLKELRLGWCSQLMGVPGLAKLRCLEYLNLQGSNALRDMEHMMKDAKLDHYRILNLPGCPSAPSHSKSTGGVWTWSVTVSFHLPNMPHLGRVGIYVGRSVGLSWTVSDLTVNEVRVVRHDDSFIIFERAEEWPRTEPVINIFEYGDFIPPKVEDEKEKKGMIRDGKRYRRIDVTLEGESDFSCCHFNIQLFG